MHLPRLRADHIRFQRVAPRIMSRRVVGMARLTSDAALVDHAHGVFLKVPDGRMETFFATPILCALFPREWLIPLWNDLAKKAC